MDITLEALADAVRNADSLTEVRRLVGPSALEEAAARIRLDTMDSIWNKYGDFDAMPPERLRCYNQLAAKQTLFENMYC